MKRKLSVTVDESIVEMLDKQLENSIFRNKSHLVEVAIKKYLDGKNGS